MALKCSVLGHAFGETEVERQREEQGSEVVITIREVETCERCGEEQVVSENKEVTAIETPSDIAADVIEDDADDEEAGADEGASDEPSDEPAAPDTAGEPADGDDATIIDDEPDGDDVAEVDASPAVADTDATADPAPSPEAEDAEIMEGSDDPADDELEDPSTEVTVPDAEGGEAVAAEDPDEDDGVILGDDEEASVAGDRSPGEWPDEPDGGDDDWSPTTALGEETEAETGGTDAVTVPEGQFYCPECEFTTEVASSSLRAGDFCPECHTGSLVHGTGE